MGVVTVSVHWFIVLFIRSYVSYVTVTVFDPRVSVWIPVGFVFHVKGRPFSSVIIRF